MRSHLHLLWAALALGLACVPRPAPKPDAVEPSTAFAGAVVDVVIHGKDFLPALQLDFDRPGRSVVQPGFTATLGDSALEDVSYVDAATLHARVPGSLAVGTWPLVVVDPTGREATLDDAFTVSVEPLRLTVESAGAGVGVEVGDVQMRVGQVLSLHAVGRRSTGAFAKDVLDATWAATGGALNETVGLAVEYSPTAPGDTVVTASHPELGTDSTGTITARACQRSADCTDFCHTSSTCLPSGACQAGPSDNDTDRDGFIDGRCPGGTDCNDGSALASPAGTEGPAGSPSCSDGLDNDCNGFIDAADPACSGTNTPPIARMLVTPSAGIAGQTFAGDGSASSDAEDPPSALTYDWDWNGDGRYDTTGITSTYRFRSSGTFVVVLRVTDTNGARAVASARVTINTPSTVTVTTPLDENDPNATPVEPGDAGLSLREAITWTNFVSGGQTIVVPGGMTIALGSRLPSIGDDTTVQGNGVLIDATDAGSSNSSCVSVSGESVTIDRVEIFGCAGTPLAMRGSDGRLTNSRFHDNGYPVLMSGQNVHLTGVEAWRSQREGIDVSGDGARVTDCTVHDNGRAGVIVNNGGATLVGTRSWSNQGAGLELANQLTNVRVLFSTLHGNTGAGLQVGMQCGTIDSRDNVFSSNGGWGVDATGTPFSHLDANDFFQNASGACHACGTLGPKTLQLDPRYTNAASHDFSLRTSSPLINAGIDVGEDRNGAASGNFNGTAPDMGALEAP